MYRLYYIPSAYAALIYSIIVFSGLALSLIVGLRLHAKDLLQTHCNNWEFLPSISTVTGDALPERQIWRTAFILCTPFRLGASIALFSILWQRGSRGLTEINRARKVSLLTTLRCSAFLTALMLFSELFRLISAVGWAMIASSENLQHHNMGFGVYMLTGLVCQITLVILVRRNVHNSRIYLSPLRGAFSLKLKKIGLVGQTACALGVVLFYIRHVITCADGSFSLGNVCEWLFASFNIFFDATSWYELEEEGWWLGGSPEIMKRLHTRLIQQITKAGVQQPPPAGSLSTPSSKSNSESSQDGVSEGSSEGGVPLYVQFGLQSEDGGGSASRTCGDGSGQKASGSQHCSRIQGVSFLQPIGLQWIGSGEPYLGADVVLHRFTFCCAPSKLTMWVADTYWAYLLFSMITHLVQHMYFMPLVKMSVSYDVFTTFLAASPVLLRIPTIRRVLLGPAPFAHSLLRPSHPPPGTAKRVAPMYVLFYLVASLSHMHFDITKNENMKLIGVSVGPFSLALAFFTRYLFPTTAMTAPTAQEEDPEESRRMVFSIPLGFVLSMLLRILHISQDPLYTDPLYNAVYGLTLGIAMTTIIYRHAMFSKTSALPFTITSLTESGDVLHFGQAEATNSSAVTTPHVRVPVGTVNASLEKKQSYGAYPIDNDAPPVTTTTTTTQSSNTYLHLATSYPAPSGMYLAVLFGSFCAASTFYFGCANVIPRMLALDPYPASLFVVAAYACGMFYSTDVVPLYNPQVESGRTEGRKLFTSQLLGARLRALFQGSWRRFGVAYLGGALVMLLATRQTNRSFEKANPHYPVRETSLREHVLLAYWGVEEDFFGSKYAAFLGGLVMSFCFGALSPVVAEITFVHQRLRRFLRVGAEVTSDAAISMKEGGSPLFSFELHWFTVFLAFGVIHALTTSYPFAPMGWLFRERSVLFQLVNLGIVYLLTLRIANQIRTSRNAPSVLSSDVISSSSPSPHASSSKAATGGYQAGSMQPASTLDEAFGDRHDHKDVATKPYHPGGDSEDMLKLRSMRRQRSMQFMMVLLIMFAMATAVVGRAVSGPSDRSIPVGRTTAVKYTEEVAAVHDALARLYRQRNERILPEQEEYVVAYNAARYSDDVEKLHQAVVNGSMTDEFRLDTLSTEAREEIWEAAQGMTFFSGLIWTVHFALDNYNVDSLERLVEQIRKTECGVVGLLESDMTHFVNGNRDMVEYVSYYLGYRYTDFGPTSVDNTYGCGLISKYPILRVRRYIMPSPLGELACLVHAELDVFGVIVQTYVGHFGNTQHWADGLLQSQFLGKLVERNPGPSLFLGYVVTNVGNKERYFKYTSPTQRGLFRDTALELYLNRSWNRMVLMGGYEEAPPEPLSGASADDGDEHGLEWKLPALRQLERDLLHVDESFRRPPEGEPLRYYFYNDTGRLASAHPRFETADRYCQYSLYKTGAEQDELPQYASKLQPMVAYLFDWYRVLGDASGELSDTEIQVTQLGFKPRLRTR